jgi:hypothetical protein
VDHQYRKWLGRKRGERCVKNLSARGFDAHLASSAKAATTFVLGLVGDCETFGLGGSETIRGLGLLEELRAMGKTLYDHWVPGLTPEELQEIRLLQGRCDCFLCSVNAVSIQGELVSVDGIGNRVSAMTFGPRRVIVVAGSNKIVPDLEAAIRRVHEVAAPMRARSLGLETPCAETGVCVDCQSVRRICNITTILHRKPLLTDISVVIVNQELGF